MLVSLLLINLLGLSVGLGSGVGVGAGVGPGVGSGVGLGVGPVVGLGVGTGPKYNKVNILSYMGDHGRLGRSLKSMV